MKNPALPTLATATGLLAFALPAAAQAEPTPCVSGTYGSLRVFAGQDLELCGAQVRGAILVRPGGSLTATDTHISGGVSAQGAAGVTLCNDTIGGYVTIRGSTGPVKVGDFDEGGEASFDNCAGNTTGALLLFNNRFGVDVSDNIVHGSMSFDNNLGSFDVNEFGFCPGRPCTNQPEVGDNFVYAAIDCEDNGGTPPGVFTDGLPDRARGAILGDCAHEGTLK